MTTETRQEDGAGAAHGERDADGHRQPHRQAVRDPDRGRHDPGDRAAEDQDARRRLRPDDVRPGLHGHGVVPLGDHLHRRRQGDPRVPRLPDRAAGREVELPRGRLPARPRRAADAAAARRVDAPDHDPHVRAREHQGVHAGLPLRRAPDGDAARLGRRAVDVLSRGERDQGRGDPLHADHPADREDADAGGVLLPPQPGHAVRLSGQRPQLPRQLPLDDLQDDRAEVRARPAARARARRPLHPARRPRAELLDERRAQRRLLAGRSLLGGRGRRRGALRAAARRRERGGAADAAADRERREHPRLHRGRQGRATSA